MDLKRLPSDRHKLRSKLICEYSRELGDKTANYIDKEYSQSKLLELCLDFKEFSLFDCMRSDYDSLSKIWLFPVLEAEAELSESLTRIFQCSYKASRDNMRRALELSVVCAYFYMCKFDGDSAKHWLKSMSQTPFFKKSVDKLTGTTRFEEFSSRCSWKRDLLGHYWHLSDIIHTNGSSYSLSVMQPIGGSYNAVSMPHLDKKQLSNALDDMIVTIQNMAVIFLLYNPVIGVELPLWEKFRDNPPLSGFFSYGQSENLWGIIPDAYRELLKQIIQLDDEVLSTIEGINSMPDK